MDKFTIDYNIINETGNTLVFDIKGSSKYGLDKCLINAIRRVLLSSIDVVGIEEKNIIIKKNNTTLHNEFIKDRISLLVLYMNSKEYMFDYLFEINKSNEGTDVKKITSQDIKVYPLKKEIKEELMKELDGDDRTLFHKLSNDNDIKYYDTVNELSNIEKDKIFRPFEMNQKQYYSLITELSIKESDTDYPELHLYAFPSILNSTINSKYNNIITYYTFKKDNKLLKNKIKEAIDIEKVKKEDIDEFQQTFKIKNSERYYHRDALTDPYWYEYSIESYNYETPKELFINALNIIKTQLDQLIKDLNILIKDPNKTETTINLLNNDNTYQIKTTKHSESIISILQSHISRYNINDQSFISLLGYKRVHPLEDTIILNMMIKPNHYDNSQNVNYIIQFILKGIEEITNNISLMINVATQKL